MTKKHSVWIVLALLILAPAVIAEETLEEIIAKNLETRGGLDNLKAVQSAKMTAAFNMGGMEITADMRFKRPRKFRMDMEMQGMTITQAYDGEQGWSVMPMMGSSEPELMAEDQLKAMEEQSDFIDGPLVDYEEKGYTVKLLGKEEVEGTDAYKIEVTRPNGDVDHLFLDTDHHLVFRQETSRSFQGQEFDVTVNFSDFKPVGDIVLPHSIQQTGGPGVAQITFTKIELNTEIADDHFAFPEKKDEAEAEETSEE